MTKANESTAATLLMLLSNAAGATFEDQELAVSIIAETLLKSCKLQPADIEQWLIDNENETIGDSLHYKVSVQDIADMSIDLM